MSNVQVETQRQTRQAEGLALTWSPVSGVIRYGFIVGFPDLPVPSVDVIMKGATRDFVIMGVPAKYSGAVDLGSPVGEERQYGLIAYRGDGSIVSVPGVQFVGARSAPRDREYHSLLPPELVRSQPVAPAPPPPAAMAPQAAPRTADPWAALQELDTRPAEVVAPAPAAAAPMTPPAAAPPADPWDVLNAPADDERVAATDTATSPVPTPSASIEYATPLIAPEPPAEPALAGVAAPPDDPWDVLNMLSSDTAVYDDSALPDEESVPIEEEAFTTDAAPSPSLPAAPIETPVFAVAPVEELAIDAPMEESPIEASVEEPAIALPVEDPLIDVSVEVAALVTPIEPVTEPIEGLPSDAALPSPPAEAPMEAPPVDVLVEALPADALVETPLVEAAMEDTVAASDFVHETVPLDEESVVAHSSVDSVDHEPSLLEDVAPPEAVVPEIPEPAIMPEAESVVAPIAEAPATLLPASDVEDAVAASPAPTWDTGPTHYWVDHPGSAGVSPVPDITSETAGTGETPALPDDVRALTWDTPVEMAPAVVDTALPEEHAAPAPELEPVVELEPVAELEPINPVTQGDQAAAPRWTEDAPILTNPPVMPEAVVEQPVMPEAEVEQQSVFATEPADVAVGDVVTDAALIEMIEMERAAEPMVTETETVEAPVDMDPFVVEARLACTRFHVFCGIAGTGSSAGSAMGSAEHGGYRGEFLGFHQTRPKLIGQPLENEHKDSQGFTVQRTTNGLLVFDPLDVRAFFVTRGEEMWVHDNNGTYSFKG